MLVIRMTDMEKYYDLISELISSCQGNVQTFLLEADKIDCPLKKKAQIVLKIASARIKSNPEMQKFMESAIDMLTENEPEMEISDHFLCALGYEKIRKYDSALRHYETCIAQLPDSSMKSALTGMKFRVLSKKEKKDDYFDLAAEAFLKAASEEETGWKKKKWETASREMVKQKKLKWE